MALRHVPGRRIRAEFQRRSDAAAFTANEKRLLDLVRTQGPLSRADMARSTDLAMQSVVRLVDGLVARGFLKPGEKVQRAGPGQPSLPMSLVADAAFTFGVSVMTDAVNIVAMDLSGRVVAQRSDPMDISERAGVIEHMRRCLTDMAGQAALDPARIFGVGVATTGYFVGRAEMNTPASMPEWALVNLEEELSKGFGLPVWVENDGNAAAAGESLYGVGRRHRDFAYVYIAGGLGGGLVVDGSLSRGFRGNAGEFTGILPTSERANRPTLALLLELLRERGVNLGGISDLVERFDPNWPGVETWLERTRPALTVILSAIAAAIDPEVIVIGGRTPPALARMIAERATYYQDRLRDRERPLPDVMAAEAEGDATSLGAAALPLKQHFFG